MDKNLNDYVEEVRKMVDEKGFTSDPQRFTDLLCRIHSEVSEAFDAWKKGKDYTTVGIELTDAFIYIAHLLSIIHPDFEELYQAKMKQNRERPYRYNTKRGG